MDLRSLCVRLADHVTMTGSSIGGQRRRAQAVLAAPKPRIATGVHSGGKQRARSESFGAARGAPPPVRHETRSLCIQCNTRGAGRGVPRCCQCRGRGRTRRQCRRRCPSGRCRQRCRRSPRRWWHPRQHPERDTEQQREGVAVRPRARTPALPRLAERAMPALEYSTRPAAAHCTHSPRRQGSRAWSYAEERTCCCVLFSESLSCFF